MEFFIGTGYDRENTGNVAKARKILEDISKPSGVTVKQVTSFCGRYHATVDFPSREALRSFLIDIEVDQGAWGMSDEEVDEYLDAMGL